MLFDLSYDLVLKTHILVMLGIITTVVIADTFGLLWWRGTYPTLAPRLMQVLHWLVVAGLTLAVITGAFMARTATSYLLTQPAFIIKVTLVIALIINAFVIHHHLAIASHTPYDALPRQQQLVLMLSGAVSTVGWVGVLIASQFSSL